MPPSTALAQGSPDPQAVSTAAYAYGPRTNNSLAVISLVFGILSWLACPFVGGIVAVILGHIARGQIRRTGESGGGLALAGLILGYAHLAAAAVIVIVWLVVLFGVLATTGGFGTLPSPSP